MHEFLEENNQTKLTDSQKKSIVHEAHEEYCEYRRMTQTLREISRQGWQLYLENQPENEGLSGEAASDSNVRIRTPIISQAVDALHAQLTLSIFPSDERFFRSVAKNELAKSKQKAVEIYKEQKYEKINLLIKASSSIKSWIIDGTLAVAFPWDPKVKKSKGYKRPYKIGKMEFGKLRKVDMDVIDEVTEFYPIAFEDWVVCPYVENLCDSPFYHVKWVNPEVLKANEVFENTEEVTGFTQWLAGDSGDGGPNLKRLKEEYLGIHYSAGGEGETTKARLIERWGDIWVDGTCYENHLLVYSNESTFHWFGPNPYDHGEKPFGLAQYIQVPNSLYGKSGIKDAIPLAHTDATLVCQTVDIISTVANAAYKGNVKDEALLEYLEQADWKIANGSVVLCSDPNSLVPLQGDLNNIGAIAAIRQGLKEEIRESTGGLPYTTGGMSTQDADRTATETQALVTGTSTRFQAVAIQYEKGILVPFINQDTENDRQFMTETVFVDETNTAITPSDIKQMRFMFDVTGSKAVMNRNKEIADFKGFCMEVLPQLLQAGLAETDGKRIIVKSADMMVEMAKMLRVKNVDDYLKVVGEENAGQLSPTLPESEQQGAPGSVAIPGGPSGLPVVPGGAGGLLPPAA